MCDSDKIMAEVSDWYPDAYCGPGSHSFIFLDSLLVHVYMNYALR